VNWSAVDISILLPAFLAGLLVLATHVPLGIQVLRKGIVFIDLAIAQIAGLGVIVAGLMDAASGGWQVQVAAALAALAGSLLLNWTERRWPDVQEAQIGVVFVLAATGGILLLAKNPHGGEYLRDLLAGQILWVGYRQLVVPLGVSVLALAVLWGGRGRLPQLVFYVVFAIAVTASVQLIGVYLVFATLIVPALGSRRQPARTRLPLAYAIGVLGYGAGLILSSALDLPSGALIVWCLVGLAIAAYATTGRAATGGAASPS
jgi:zinc/manganese transport system permease protein